MRRRVVFADEYDLDDDPYRSAETPTSQTGGARPKLRRAGEDIPRPEESTVHLDSSGEPSGRMSAHEAARQNVVIDWFGGVRDAPERLGRLSEDNAITEDAKEKASYVSKVEQAVLKAFKDRRMSPDEKLCTVQLIVHHACKERAACRARHNKGKDRNLISQKYRKIKKDFMDKGTLTVEREARIDARFREEVSKIATPTLGSIWDSDVPYISVKYLKACRDQPSWLWPGEPRTPMGNRSPKEDQDEFLSDIYTPEESPREERENRRGRDSTSRQQQLDDTRKVVRRTRSRSRGRSRSHGRQPQSSGGDNRGNRRSRSSSRSRRTPETYQRSSDRESQDSGSSGSGRTVGRGELIFRRRRENQEPRRPGILKETWNNNNRRAYSGRDHYKIRTWNKFMDSSDDSPERHRPNESLLEVGLREMERTGKLPRGTAGTHLLPPPAQVERAPGNRENPYSWKRDPEEWEEHETNFGSDPVWWKQFLLEQDIDGDVREKDKAKVMARRFRAQVQLFINRQNIGMSDAFVAPGSDIIESGIFLTGTSQASPDLRMWQAISAVYYTSLFSAAKPKHLPWEPYTGENPINEVGVWLYKRAKGFDVLKAVPKYLLLPEGLPTHLNRAKDEVLQNLDLSAFRLYGLEEVKEPERIPDRTEVPETWEELDSTTSVETALKEASLEDKDEPPASAMSGSGDAPRPPPGIDAPAGSAVRLTKEDNKITGFELVPNEDVVELDYDDNDLLGMTPAGSTIASQEDKLLDD